MKNLQLFLVVALCFLFVENTSAQRKKKQENRFDAGIIFGATSSQIDGDDYEGFDKWGIMGGLHASAKINHSWSLLVDFLFVQKGSLTETRDGSLTKDRMLHLNYVEVPFLFDLNLDMNDRSAHLFLGLSYNRRIGFNIQEDTSLLFFKPSYESLQGEWRKSELAGVFGISYQFSDHIHAGARLNVGLTKMYSHPYYDSNDPEILAELSQLQAYNVYKFQTIVLHLRNYYAGIYTYYVF